MIVHHKWPPENDSIFGNVQQGVPNPGVFHRHPWPTRYHGPNWTSPGTAKPSYVVRPYAKTSYMGVGAAPLFDHVTGSAFLDATAGAAIGFFATPSKKDQVLWAVVGGLAGYAAGLAGLLGLGAVLYMKAK